MLKHSRVSTTPDVGRMGKALRAPGMDTRTWVALAVVTAVQVDPNEGVFANVTLMPFGTEATARVGQEYAGDGFGFYTPIEVNDEVLVAAPDGDPDNGLIVTRRLYSASDPPPAEAAEFPDDVLLVIREDKTMRILVVGDGLVEIRSRGGTSRALAFKDELKAVDDKYAAHIHQDSTSAPTGGPLTAVIPNPTPPFTPPFLPGPGLPSVNIVGTAVLKAE